MFNLSAKSFFTIPSTLLYPLHFALMGSVRKVFEGTGETG